MDTKYPRGVEVVGPVVIENSEGKILMTQSPKWNNRWTFPGGHAEVGEDMVTAQTREVEEEVCLKVKFIDIITWGELINSKDFHRTAHFVYNTDLKTSPVRAKDENFPSSSEDKQLVVCVRRNPDRKVVGFSLRHLF